MTDNKPKPTLDNCPFCGGHCYIDDRSSFLGEFACTPVCDNEGCVLNKVYPTYEKAAEAWNRRSSPQAADAGRQPSYRMYPGKCPRCRGQMIENKRRIECGEMDCSYVKEVKP